MIKMFHVSDKEGEREKINKIKWGRNKQKKKERTKGRKKEKITWKENERKERTKKK
jgi:hypothetical protein